LLSFEFVELDNIVAFTSGDSHADMCMQEVLSSARASRAGNVFVHAFSTVRECAEPSCRRIRFKSWQAVRLKKLDRRGQRSSTQREAQLQLDRRGQRSSSSTGADMPGLEPPASEEDGLTSRLGEAVEVGSSPASDQDGLTSGTCFEDVVEEETPKESEEISEELFLEGILLKAVEVTASWGDFFTKQLPDLPTAIKTEAIPESGFQIILYTTTFKRTYQLEKVLSLNLVYLRQYRRNIKWLIVDFNETLEVERLIDREGARALKDGWLMLYRAEVPWTSYHCPIAKNTAAMTGIRRAPVACSPLLQRM
jgi:hypothetical protein